MGKVRLGQVKLWAQPQNRDGRPLAAAEKWENRPASWVGLLQDLDRIQRHIEALRRIAQYQLGWMRQLRETSNHVPQQRQVIRR